jgi:AdoMet-dependent rRNA methyltransferase SPB1
LTAEAVELATQLVNRKITASQLIDQGFNRLTMNNKDVLREKQRALDARPIKKIAEAKARKKFKAVQRLTKAKKKADGIMETDDLNDNEKARQVGKLIGKSKSSEKRPEKKIVIARGANKGVKGRPKGVKGRYKIVDARMRKEVRALKRINSGKKNTRR